jgi:hypothetical protein
VRGEFAQLGVYRVEQAEAHIRGGLTLQSEFI